MLTSNSEPKYNVIIEGKVKKRKISKLAAESYILGLNENEQLKAKLIPVTEDGKEVLFG